MGMIERATVKVRWTGKQPLFYIQRLNGITATGYWTGKGWTQMVYRAVGYQNADAAFLAAIDSGCNSFRVLDNMTDHNKKA